MRLWRRRSTADFAAEVEAHLAIETDRLMRERGLSESDAQSRARHEFGNLGAVKERFYQDQTLIWAEHIRRDVVRALRSLRRTPGFTVVVLATLSLGIGSVTTIFSIANTALFRPFRTPTRTGSSRSPRSAARDPTSSA
jgi:putative ABC transport system permease protein